MMNLALFFWGVVSVIRILADRPIARTVTRSVREQVPGTGTERTTHTTRSGQEQLGRNRNGQS